MASAIPTDVEPHSPGHILTDHPGQLLSGPQHGKKTPDILPETNDVGGFYRQLRPFPPDWKPPTSAVAMATASLTPSPTIRCGAFRTEAFLTMAVFPHRRGPGLQCQSSAPIRSAHTLHFGAFIVAGSQFHPADPQGMNERFPGFPPLPVTHP